MRPHTVFCSVLVAVSAANARADLGFTLDKLDAADGFPLPPDNLVVVDLLVTPPPDEVWVATYLWGATQHGAHLVYHGLTNPGLAHRFVTFFSQPLGRDDDMRFT